MSKYRQQIVSIPSSVRGGGGLLSGPRPAALLSVVLVVTSLVVAPAFAQFRLFDNFADEVLGPLDDQDGWQSSGGDNRVVVNPAGDTNQVMYVPSDSSVIHKSLLDENVGVPNGTVRMMFMRMRVSQKQTFSVGLSPRSNPSEFSDFGTEVGMANSSNNLDLRVWDDDGDNYENLTNLTPDRWYNMWVLVDALTDEYQIWLHDRPGHDAVAGDQLSAPDGDDMFEFCAGGNGNLFQFYVKTAGGGSSTNFGPVYFDDIYVELTDALNLTNPVPACDFDGDVDVDVDDVNLLLAVGDLTSGVIAVGGENDGFDLTMDGLIDGQDLDQWLACAGSENGLASPYKYGDANLDGLVDVSDFNQWNAGKFSATGTWNNGDFNGDGSTDVVDFNFWNSNKFTASDQVASVPEPTGCLWSIPLALLLAWSRSRSV